MRETLIKIGPWIVRHGRYVVLSCQVAVPGALFSYTLHGERSGPAEAAAGMS